MSRASRVADDGPMTVAQLISDMALEGRAPMPVDAPPVGPARARRLRLLRLRETLTDVDVDAVAEAIARRAVFASELRRQLAEDAY
jgi:hypothetical protein